MQTPALSPLSYRVPQRSRYHYRPGDLVTTATGYPALYEIICLETNNQVRVRELNWSADHTVIVWAREVRPVTRILTD